MKIHVNINIINGSKSYEVTVPIMSFKKIKIM